MSRATSATTGRRYGLKRVCGTWERSRSALYARRARAQCPTRGERPARRGPPPALSDAQLLAAIRTDLARSPSRARAIILVTTTAGTGDGRWRASVGHRLASMGSLGILVVASTVVLACDSVPEDPECGRATRCNNGGTDMD